MGEKKKFQVELTEDEYTSLCNLSVTIHENMNTLEETPDVEGLGSIGDTMDLTGLNAVLGQLSW